ncbi:MAG: hypothetical protein KC609_02700 [Myxococcales bacterium]|nr:hypothetical protein [Myxococcales bacterium]
MRRARRLSLYLALYLVTTLVLLWARPLAPELRPALRPSGDAAGQVLAHAQTGVRRLYRRYAFVFIVVPGADRDLKRAYRELEERYLDLERLRRSRPARDPDEMRQFGRAYLAAQSRVIEGVRLVEARYRRARRMATAVALLLSLACGIVATGLLLPGAAVMLVPGFLPLVSGDPPALHLASFIVAAPPIVAAATLLLVRLWRRRRE